MKQKRQRTENTPTSVDVFYLLGILARVTRRIVDDENSKSKQERKA